MNGIVYNPADVHHCEQPYAANYPSGTIFYCDECGKYWRVKDVSTSARYTPKWRRISRMRAHRIIAKHG